MAVFILRKVSQNLFALTVPPVSNHSNIKGPFLSKKNMNITFPARIEERVFLGGEESRDVAIPYSFVSLPDRRNGTRFRRKPQSGTGSCFPLCDKAVNAGSKHLFADTSGPQ